MLAIPFLFSSCEIGEMPKTGFDIRHYQDHSYVTYKYNGKVEIVHDPDCKCLEKHR